MCNPSATPSRWSCDTSCQLLQLSRIHKVAWCSWIRRDCTALLAPSAFSYVLRCTAWYTFYRSDLSWSCRSSWEPPHHQTPVCLSPLAAYPVAGLWGRDGGFVEPLHVQASFCGSNLCTRLELLEQPKLPIHWSTGMIGWEPHAAYRRMLHTCARCYVIKVNWPFSWCSSKISRYHDTDLIF